MCASACIATLPAASDSRVLESCDDGGTRCRTGQRWAWTPSWNDPGSTRELGGRMQDRSIGSRQPRRRRAVLVSRVVYLFRLAEPSVRKHRSASQRGRDTALPGAMRDVRYREHGQGPGSEATRTTCCEGTQGCRRRTTVGECLLCGYKPTIGLQTPSNKVDVTSAMLADGVRHPPTATAPSQRYGESHRGTKAARVWMVGCVSAAPRCLAATLA